MIRTTTTTITAQTVLAVCRRIEPLVAIQQLGSALFDTALQMVVKERCANATDGGLNSTSTVDSRQKAMTDFFMTYNLLAKLTPIVPAIILAKLGDRGWRKAPIVSPLVGYMLSRLVLLLVVVLRLPIQVMWVGVTLHGFSGGFSAIWAAVMTVVSLGSAGPRRSMVMMRVELVYGLAGLVGSLVSGHLFQMYDSYLGQGTVLVATSLLLYGLCLLYAVFLLEEEEVEETTQLINHVSSGEEEKAESRDMLRRNMVNIGLLFAGGVLFDVGVAGAGEILVSFQMKEPLNWNAKQVGYGNASGFLIFLTSFLGVMVMSRWVSDATLIIIGMLSFSSGIYFMAFVKGSSYGIILTSFQLSFKVASLAYTPAYTKIYQYTLDWLAGFVFLLSSFITVLATIPVSVVGCRLVGQTSAYQRIEAS
ncbi:hypothetical protein CRUP_018286 [Coryphaenoides rupestris]|nr:hypothetical protein CRUP_018286 [Coryphaenoides rupestris]